RSNSELLLLALARGSERLRTGAAPRQDDVFHRARRSERLPIAGQPAGRLEVAIFLVVRGAETLAAGGALAALQRTAAIVRSIVGAGAAGFATGTRRATRTAAHRHRRQLERIGRTAGPALRSAEQCGQLT